MLSWFLFRQTKKFNPRDDERRIVQQNKLSHNQSTTTEQSRWQQAHKFPHNISTEWANCSRLHQTLKIVSTQGQHKVAMDLLLNSAANRLQVYRLFWCSSLHNLRKSLNASAVETTESNISALKRNVLLFLAFGASDIVSQTSRYEKAVQTKVFEWSFPTAFVDSDSTAHHHFIDSSRQKDNNLIRAWKHESGKKVRQAWLAVKETLKVQDKLKISFIETWCKSEHEIAFQSLRQQKAKRCLQLRGIEIVPFVTKATICLLGFIQKNIFCTRVVPWTTK